MRKLKIVLPVFAMVVLAPAAPAETGTMAKGNLRQDSATAHTLGFVFQSHGVTDGSNRAVRLFFRKLGTRGWREGPELLQHRNRRASARTFAGLLTGLAPQTNYEVVVRSGSLVDARKATQRFLVATTRPLPPVISETADNIVVVSDMAALQTAVNKAKSGRVILLRPGIYQGQLSIRSISGSPNAPITIRGSSGLASVIDAGGGVAVSIQDSNYIHLERLAIHNANTGIAVRDWITGDGTIGNTIRGNLITGVVVGIEAKTNNTGRGGHRNLYVAENLMIGTNVFGDTSQATWDDEGIVVAGQGIEVANNTLAGFGDSIGLTHAASDLPNRGIDIHHNLILWSGDDGVELDFSDRNTAAHHNMISNSANGISFQYVENGPAYAFRNVIYNTETGPYKIKPEAKTNKGVLIYNNTSVKSGRPWLNHSGSPDGIEIKNNLFVGDGVNIDVVRADTMFMKNLVMDYNAWSDNGLFQVGGVGLFRSFGAWKARSGQGAHDELLQGSRIFSDPKLAYRITDFRVYRSPIDADFSLESNSAAIDAGVIIPGITDTFQGVAPDIGAWEGGEPRPVYGARLFADHINQLRRSRRR